MDRERNWGNPGVIHAYPDPDPDPTKTRARTQGRGFSGLGCGFSGSAGSENPTGYIESIYDNAMALRAKPEGIE